MLLYYMSKFFNLSEKRQDVGISFIMKEFDMDIDEFNRDISFYNDTLDDLTSKTIKDGSKLLEKQNRLSLLAMVIYSFKNEIDLDDWLTKYAECNNAYNTDQFKNYLHMKQDFEQFQINSKENKNDVHEIG